MRKKAFIFDLDGTLVDTLSSIAYFGNRALEHYGFSPIEKEKYRYMVGNGAKTLVRRMLKENGSEREEDFARVYPFYHTGYDNDPLYLAAPYPGIPEVLRELKARGCLLAVLSNKPHSATRPIITALFGDDTFDAVYGQREGVPLKPDPAALEGILAELSLSPAECAYVGDTAVDMQTGRNAGLFTVGVTWGFREEAELKAEHPQAVISRAEQLLALTEEKEGFFE